MEKLLRRSKGVFNCCECICFREFQHTRAPRRNKSSVSQESVDPPHQQLAVGGTLTLSLARSRLSLAAVLLDTDDHVDAETGESHTGFCVGCSRHRDEDEGGEEEDGDNASASAPTSASSSSSSSSSSPRQQELPMMPAAKKKQPAAAES